jgi:hypothetical protein
MGLPSFSRNDKGSLINQATTRMCGICINLGESDKISISKTGDAYDSCREDIS